jgi:predicted RNase H-like nuclease
VHCECAWSVCAWRAGLACHCGGDRSLWSLGSVSRLALAVARVRSAVCLSAPQEPGLRAGARLAGRDAIEVRPRGAASAGLRGRSEKKYRDKPRVPRRWSASSIYRCSIGLRRAAPGARLRTGLWTMDWTSRRRALARASPSAAARGGGDLIEHRREHKTRERERMTM